MPMEQMMPNFASFRTGLEKECDGRRWSSGAGRPERQPRDVRGGRRGVVQGLRGQAVLAQGQVLHDPVGGAVSRLHAEGDHLGAGAGAAAGRMLAADPERLLAAFEFMAKYGISGVIGGGSAEGGAVARLAASTTRHCHNRSVISRASMPV